MEEDALEPLAGVPVLRLDLTFDDAPAGLPELARDVCRMQLAVRQLRPAQSTAGVVVRLEEGHWQAWAEAWAEATTLAADRGQHLDESLRPVVAEESEAEEEGLEEEEDDEDEDEDDPEDGSEASED